MQPNGHLHIGADTSPEVAIKIAYDFARRLRRSGAREEDLTDDLSEWVDRPYRRSPLLRYLRAGFAAGYHGDTLPWVKDVDIFDARPPVVDWTGAGIRH